MSKKIIVLSILFILILMVVGCSKFTNSNDNPGNNNQESTTIEATLYFANKEYIQTGNENLEKLLPQRRKFKFKNMTKEEAIIKQLHIAPENINVDSSIPSNVKLNRVDVLEGTAYVDFSSENLTGGSLEERLMIDQIIKTLTELEYIDKVQFLVDGEISESLMGHINISKPFIKPIED